MRRWESREKSSKSIFSAASAWAALSSRMAPRMVFSASTLAGSPESKARVERVAIQIESRPEVACVEGGFNCKSGKLSEKTARKISVQGLRLSSQKRTAMFTNLRYFALAPTGKFSLVFH